MSEWSLRARVRLALRLGPITSEAVAKLLDANPEGVHQALQVLRRAGVASVSGNRRDGFYWRAV